MWHVGSHTALPTDAVDLVMTNGTVAQMYEHEGTLVIRVWKHDDQHEHGGENATMFRAVVNTEGDSPAWDERREFAIEEPGADDAMERTVFPHLLSRDARAAELAAEGQPHAPVERTVLVGPWTPSETALH